MESKFDNKYYDANYFAVKGGKKFNDVFGQEDAWSYNNPEGEWAGCEPVVKAWKQVFKCQNLLDVGMGRGTFVAYARAIGIEAFGFDFSEWACTHLYVSCEGSWVKCMDATQKWDYPDKSFDLITVLDLMEHLYQEDIDKVINEIYRVAKKYVFLQICTVYNENDKKYALRKGETVPIDIEVYAVAGHVTVQDRQFWVEKLKRDGWILRDDLVLEFIKYVPPNVVSNWLKNTVLVLEKV